LLAVQTGLELTERHAADRVSLSQHKPTAVVVKRGLSHVCVTAVKAHRTQTRGAGTRRHTPLIVQVDWVRVLVTWKKTLFHFYEHIKHEAFYSQSMHYKNSHLLAYLLTYLTAATAAVLESLEYCAINTC